MKTVDCLLEDAGWAVEDLAERANLTNERAEAIALGRWPPNPAERQRIAAAFDIACEPTKKDGQTRSLTKGI